MWLPKSTPGSRTLIAECEAFVLGKLADHIDGEGRHVPVWVWTNLLAHGSESDLLTERGFGKQEGTSAVRRWRAARSYLAGEVLDAAERYDSLSALQRDVLAVLESDLASMPDTDWWCPGEWVNCVRARLSMHSQEPERLHLRHQF